MKQRNVAIEIWRFLISVAIIGFHVGWIIAMSCNGSLGYWMERSNWFFGSSEVLLIFTGTRRLLYGGPLQKAQLRPRLYAAQRQLPGLGLRLGTDQVPAACSDAGVSAGGHHQHRLLLP